MSLDQYASKGEAVVVRRLLNYICKQKRLPVSIDDGEEIVISKSTDLQAIYPLMATTEEDRVLVFDTKGKQLGTFWLVYGNDPSGEELIADMSGGDLMDEINDHVMKLFK